MNRHIIFLLVSFLLTIQIHAQKSVYEAYMGTRINWNDDKLMERNIASCNSSKLSVIPFNQNDNVWGDEIMVGTMTIGSSGCAMTCMAMLLNSHGQLVTPKILNDYLKQNSGYTSEGGIKWNVAGDFGSSTIGDVGFTDFTYIGIRTMINGGNPVIMQVYMNDPDHSHFIIITGYEDDGDEPKDFYINDPAGGKALRLLVYEDDCQAGYSNLRIFSGVNTTCIELAIPEHCFNCLWEPQYGEVDVDCGGECPPCFKTNYSLLIDNSNEIAEEIIAAGCVSIESENGQILELSTTKAIKAGDEILLKSNTSLPFGSDITLKTTKNVNELSRDCDDPCIYVPNYYNIGVFPDLVVSVTNIEHIHYILVNRNGVTVNQYNESVYYDGNIFLFELPPPEIYFSISDYIACTGEIFHVESSVTIVDNSENLNISDSKSIFKTQGNSDILDYLIFPNPTTGIINLILDNYADEIIRIEVRQISGQMIINELQEYKDKIILDLSLFLKGIYLLTLKTSDKVFNEKIVLQ